MKTQKVSSLEVVGSQFCALQVGEYDMNRIIVALTLTCRFDGDIETQRYVTVVRENNRGHALSLYELLGEDNFYSIRGKQGMWKIFDPSTERHHHGDSPMVLSEGQQKEVKMLLKLSTVILDQALIEALGARTREALHELGRTV
jgi:hypothetical protein